MHTLIWFGITFFRQKKCSSQVCLYHSIPTFQCYWFCRRWKLSAPVVYQKVYLIMFFKNWGNSVSKMIQLKWTHFEITDQYTFKKRSDERGFIFNTENTYLISSSFLILHCNEETLPIDANFCSVSLSFLISREAIITLHPETWIIWDTR